MRAKLNLCFISAESRATIWPIKLIYPPPPMFSSAVLICCPHLLSVLRRWFCCCLVIVYCCSHCLFVFVVVQYFVAFPDLQSSRWGRESWLLYFVVFRMSCSVIVLYRGCRGLVCSMCLWHFLGSYSLINDVPNFVFSYCVVVGSKPSSCATKASSHSNMDSGLPYLSCN